MKAGDLVLVSSREFQDSKLDIIHKYNEGEKQNLINYKEIPPSFGNQNEDTEDWGFSFDFDNTENKNVDIDNI